MTITVAASALAIVMIAWIAASAQERRAPWPPRPVAPPEAAPPNLPPPPVPAPLPTPNAPTMEGANKLFQLRNDKILPTAAQENLLPKLVEGGKAGVIVLPDPESLLPTSGRERPEAPPRRLPVEPTAPPVEAVPETKPANVQEDPTKTIESLLQAIRDRTNAEPPKALANTPGIPEIPPITDVKPSLIESPTPAIEKTPPAPLAKEVAAEPKADPLPLVAKDPPAVPKLDPLPPLPLFPMPKAETKVEPKAEPKIETKAENHQVNKPLPLPLPGLPGLTGLPAKSESPTAEPPTVKVETRPEPGRFVLVKPVRRNERDPDLFEEPRNGGDKVTPPPQIDPDVSITPQVTVEKRGPFAQKLGPALTYQVLVKNVGTTLAGNIRIEDEIPGSIRMTECDPRPDQYAGDKAIWLMTSLKPGEERLIQMKLQSDKPGEMASNTSVHVFVSTTFRTKILPNEKGAVATEDEGPNLNPPMPRSDLNRLPLDPSRAFSVEARPVSAKLGQTAMIEVTIFNRSTQPADGLQLFAKVPAGLKHPRGNEIFADLPPVKPGESRLFKIPLTAAAAGTHPVEIRIVGRAGEASTTANVEIASTTAMTVTQPATTRLALNRDGELQIQVTNHQEKNLRNIELVDRLPNNLEFVSATDRGLYQQATRTVHWLLDSLPAGQTKTVTLKVQPKAPGQLQHEVIARAMHLPEQKSASTLEVEGFASLTLKIRDREDPVELGKDAVYEINVENRGSTAATNVRVVVLMDEGMQPRSATGPLAFQVQGRTIAFSPIPRLAPGSTTTLQVMTTATVVGDRRVRVQATSDQESAPVWREESTTAYRE